MEENVEISLNEPDDNKETPPVEPVAIIVHNVAKDVGENSELGDKIKEFESTIVRLQEEISGKTDVINNLEKQKASFEKEATNVSFPCLK